VITTVQTDSVITLQSTVLTFDREDNGAEGKRADGNQQKTRQGFLLPTTTKRPGENPRHQVRKDTKLVRSCHRDCDFM